MKISVALCTYNGEKYIKEQIKSIMSQTLQVDEIVIGDDNSTDHTIEIINHFFSNTDIEVKIHINKENLGFKKNFYNTIANCEGDIIFFSDQDDVWENTKVEKMTEIFKQHENAMLVFSNAYVTDENLNNQTLLFDSLHYRKEFMKNSQEQFKHLLADNYVTGATTAIRKELIEKARPVPLDVAHDYWFAIVAALYDALYAVDLPLIKYRQHSSNTIGINNRINIGFIKKLFSKQNNDKNNENKYAELRLPLLRHLKSFIASKHLNNDYMKINDDFYVFWQKREQFSKNHAMSNIIIVLKDAISKKQYHYRNTDKPILKDFIKALALAGRDR